MGSSNLVLDRFLGAIYRDAEKLQEKEGDEINPTGERVVGGSAFKDHCRYVYSLSSLHSALKSLASFDGIISSRMEQKEEKSENEYNADLKRLVDLPSSVAFDLRGYIGAFSEENMVLVEDKLQELRDILKSWSSSSMNNGKVQDKLYQFLWDYALTQICDVDSILGGNAFSQGEKDEYIKDRVNREIKAFKDVLNTCFIIVWDMFNSVWDGFQNNLNTQKEEKVSQQEYIDRVIDEKLQQVRADIKAWTSLVEKLVEGSETAHKSIMDLYESIKDLYKSVNDLQRQSIQQQNNNGWYKCPVIKAFNRPCQGKVKHGEHCEECGTYFP